MNESYNLDWTLINILHVLILTPLLIYIGVSRNNSSQELVILLITLIIFGIIYHIKKLIKRFDGISIAHIIFGIIGIYYLIISTMNMSVANKKIKWFYYTLILLGVYTFIKHTYYLYKIKLQFYINQKK